MTSTKKKRGRPLGWRKANPKSYTVTARLTEDEFGWLVAQAADGESVSDVVRKVIEEKRTKR